MMLSILISLRSQLILQSFLSAFLLFLIQPIFATQWTPFFGGAASVWSICLLAFQCLLMIGYAVALTNLSQKTHIICLIFAWLWFLITSFLSLERLLSPQLLQSPSIALLLIFFIHIGPIYLVLSLTSPYLQKYYFHQIEAPERLFAFSNLGSLLALILFPILIVFGLPTIQMIYHILLICLIFMFLMNLRHLNAYDDSQINTNLNTLSEKIINLSPLHQIAILFYSALGSALLVASSQTVSQDLGAHPFLWTLFLAAYLLSHVFTFAWPTSSPPTPILILSLFALIAILNLSYHASLYTQTFGIALCFMIICWHIHHTMLSFMPPKQKKTFAYLLMSIGGAIGGAIAGPLSFSFFNAPYELHFFLIIWTLSLLLVKGFQFQQEIYQINQLADPLLLPHIKKWRFFQICLLLSISPLLFQLYQGIQKFNRDDAISYRNFYGYLQIREIAKKNQPPIKHLLDGRISHGFQYLGERSQEPTAYFARHSGVGQAFELIKTTHLQSDLHQPIQVSILGLGIGTLSAYAQRNDHFQFFDINPDVIFSAHQHFSFLSDAQKRGARLSIWEGDGRQMIHDHVLPASQDLLVLDAFSGDAPPPHLITWQAMAMYLNKVRKDGMIAMNVSNLHLDLRAIVVGAMRRFGLYGIWIRERADSPLGVYLSDWVILSRNREVLKGFKGGAWIGEREEEKGVDWGDEGGAIWGF